MDTLPKILPADFGSRDWRFGALGLVFNSTVTPVLGLVIAAAAAIVAGQWRALRVISVLFLVVAAVALVGGLMFLVDYSGIAGGLDERAAGSFRVATWKTALIVLLLLPAAIWLGIGGLRASRGGSAPVQDRNANLVVGQ
ncbi:MAG TPA: hypothetical protein VF037_12425 [Gemmatimonadales bacterium]